MKLGKIFKLAALPVAALALAGAVPAQSSASILPPPKAPVCAKIDLIKDRPVKTGDCVLPNKTPKIEVGTMDFPFICVYRPRPRY